MRMREGDETSGPDCLTDEELGFFAAGAASLEERDAFVRHLARCEACCDRWTGAVAEEEKDGVPVEGHALDADRFARDALAVRRTVLRSPWMRIAAGAAAAVLVSFVLVKFLWGPVPDRLEGDARRIAPGRSVTGVSEDFSARAGADEIVQIPDGSRFRAVPGTVARFEAPGSGDRCVVRLARGTLDAEVARAHGRVRIMSPAGEVVVVGTAFRVRAFTVHAPVAGETLSFQAVPVLSVEVSEGKVDLFGEAGAVRPVAAGQRGITRGGQAPVVQEARAIPWREALRQWGTGWASPGFAASWDSLILLAGSWDGVSGWKEVSARGVVGQDAGAARVLTALTAEAPEHAVLVEWLSEEPDERVRLALLPHVARTAASPEASRAVLEEAARKDPSEAVRRQAARWARGGGR